MNLPTTKIMKLATWNVNSLTVRLSQLLDWRAAQKTYNGVALLTRDSVENSTVVKNIPALKITRPA